MSRLFKKGFLTLGLFLAAVSSPLSASAASGAGQECDAKMFGTTQLDPTGEKIIACLKDNSSSTQHRWKATFGSERGTCYALRVENNPSTGALTLLSNPPLPAGQAIDDVASYTIDGPGLGATHKIECKQGYTRSGCVGGYFWGTQGGPTGAVFPTTTINGCQITGAPLGIPEVQTICCENK